MKTPLFGTVALATLIASPAAFAGPFGPHIKVVGPRVPHVRIGVPVPHVVVRPRLFAPVRVRVAPPPLRVEVRSRPPLPGHLWIGGHWYWEGGRHVWINGYWDAPQGGQTWVEGRWVNQGGEWVFEPGHWAPVQATVMVAPPPQVVVSAPPPQVVIQAPPPQVAMPSPVVTATVSADGEVDAPPPMEQMEVRPMAPQQGQEWIPGYWGWQGGRHTWIAGHWEGQRAGWVWQPHRWERRGRGWRLVPGHWHPN